MIKKAQETISFYVCIIAEFFEFFIVVNVNFHENRCFILEDSNFFLVLIELIDVDINSNSIIIIHLSNQPI
jgi:hypothetical protein